MSTEEFYKELSFVDASKSSRLKYAQMVLDNMTLFPKLLEVLLMVNDRLSYRAAWVLEFVCKEYVYAIAPYLEIFTKNLNKIHLDSAVRPVAKVCAHIANTYSAKQHNPFKKIITPIQIKRMVDASFYWLISNQKVATKVHAMQTLYLFGKDHSWIHHELIQILEQDYHVQSAGYKARAKHILRKINKPNK